MALCLLGNRVFYRVFMQEKKNELELEAAHAKLKEVDEAKSALFATISHELKTPMTLIVNPIEEAFTRGSSEGIQLARQQADMVRRNAYRLATMISDLIELARGEIGKKQIAPSEIANVKMYADDLVRSMVPLFKEKGIQVTLRMEAVLQPHFFDIHKMDKVLYNLLSNALKFTPSGGRVSMELQDVDGGREKPDLRIRISDTGIGIPQNKIAQIFDRFMQVETGSTRSFEGMGIGLSLVKDFVEQHGGSVTVASQEGKGTSFTILLPRGKEFFKVPALEGVDQASENRLDFTRALIRGKAEEGVRAMEAESRAAATQESIASQPGRKTLLIVEDNPELSETVRQMLSYEYNILTASNGKEGLDKAKQSRPDLIQSDIMMPIMGGCRMAREIRAEPRLKAVPIIFLTAKAGKEGLSEAFESGGNDYLTKPFSPQELKLRVKNLLVMRDLLEAEMLRQENLATIGTLTSGLAHDMNNYVSTMSLSVTLLREIYKESGVSHEEFEQILRTLVSAENGVESIRRLIRSLTVYSQKNVTGMRDEDLVNTTLSVIDLARTRLPPNMKLDYQAPPSLKCRFNPHALNPALFNLINNAMDACQSSPEAHVQISVSNGNGGALIAVRDNGTGIPQEIRDRTWDPYFTTKGIEKGTGLGLWMARRAVEVDNRGRIWFETGSEGTTFFIKLPPPEETTI